MILQVEGIYDLNTSKINVTFPVPRVPGVPPPRQPLRVTWASVIGEWSLIFKGKRNMGIFKGTKISSGVVFHDVFFGDPFFFGLIKLNTHLW